MRTKKALENIICEFLLELVTVVCGLIVPRLIIGTFGSGINGLSSSISQFLSYIVLLESGVGGVMRAALYKPLAENDINSISGIIKASERFFKKIAFIFLAYLLVLSVIYPFIVQKDFDYLFTFSLVLIIGISTFFQYYFGISYQILLQADQRQYISSLMRIGTMVVNSVMIILLIKIGASIHIVKLGSSIVFLARPIMLNLYVKKKYSIIKSCEPDNNAIKQKWDGLGHHIAYFVHNNTDIVLLTIFTNVKEVSVYSVYYMIISNISKIVTIFSTGLEAAFGNMIAKAEKETLSRYFYLFEFIVFSLTTILFTSTSLLIMPFISIYTRGVTDVNYNRPLFAYILTAAIAAYCIRIPYHAVVLAAGHFKQTKKGAYLEAAINVIVSIVLVNIIGIEGVAIGTLVAMLYRTIQYAFYLSKNVIQRSSFCFIKKLIIYMVSVLVIILFVNIIQEPVFRTYYDWLNYAIIVTVIALLITLAAGLIFFRMEIHDLISIAKGTLSKKREVKKREN